MQPFELIRGERYLFIAHADAGPHYGYYSGVFDGADPRGNLKFREAVQLDTDIEDFSIEAAGILDIERLPIGMKLVGDWTEEFAALERTKEVRAAG